MEIYCSEARRLPHRIRLHLPHFEVSFSERARTHQPPRLVWWHAPSQMERGMRSRSSVSRRVRRRWAVFLALPLERKLHLPKGANSSNKSCLLGALSCISLSGKSVGYFRCFTSTQNMAKGKEDRNVASSCSGIFSRILRFYYIASSPGASLPRLLDEHRDIVGSSAISASSCPKHVTSSSCQTESRSDLDSK